MAAKPIRKQQGGKAALKLLLIPFAYVYYRLMLLMDLRQMEFLERFMDAWGVKDYLPSLIVLLITLIGLGLLIAFAPAKRAGTALGFVLLLLPAWYLGPTRVGPIGALAYGDLGLEHQKLFLEILPLAEMGMTLHSSGLFLPEKSVTALAGVEEICG